MDQRHPRAGVVDMNARGMLYLKFIDVLRAGVTLALDKILRLKIGSENDPDRLALQIPPSNQEPVPRAKPGIQRNDLVESFLSPLPLDEFVAEYLEKKPLIRENGSRVHIEKFFSLERFGELLAHRIPRLDQLRWFSKNGQEREITGDHSRVQDIAEHVFARGGSIIFNNLSRTDGQVNTLATEFQKCFGVGGNVNAYLTGPHSQALPCHWDGHDVFVFQVSGEKEWSIYEPVRELPLDERTVREKTSLIHRFKLRKGDFMYMPRGFLHEAKTGDTISLHLTFGMYTLRTAEVMKKLVDEALEKCKNDAHFRISIPPGDFDDARRMNNLFETLKAKFIAQLDVSHAGYVANREYLSLLTREKKVEGGIWNSYGMLGEMVPETPLARNETPFFVESGLYKGIVQLIIAGEKILVPEKFHPALNFILSKKEFKFGEIPPENLGLEEKKELVRELVYAGLMYVKRVSPSR